jgi:hypothetical protein
MLRKECLRVFSKRFPQIAVRNFGRLVHPLSSFLLHANVMLSVVKQIAPAITVEFFESGTIS